MAQGASVTPRIPNRLFGPGVFVGGAFAGLLAGIIMGFSASAYAGAIGAGWPLPMQNVAATYYGPMAYVGTAGVGHRPKEELVPVRDRSHGEVRQERE